MASLVNLEFSNLSSETLYRVSERHENTSMYLEWIDVYIKLLFLMVFVGNGHVLNNGESF